VKESKEAGLTEATEPGGLVRVENKEESVIYPADPSSAHTPSATTVPPASAQSEPGSTNTNADGMVGCVSNQQPEAGGTPLPIAPQIPGGNKSGEATAEADPDHLQPGRAVHESVRGRSPNQRSSERIITTYSETGPLAERAPAIATIKDSVCDARNFPPTSVKAPDLSGSQPSAAEGDVKTTRGGGRLRSSTEQETGAEADLILENPAAHGSTRGLKSLAALPIGASEQEHEVFQAISPPAQTVGCAPSKIVPEPAIGLRQAELGNGYRGNPYQKPRFNLIIHRLDVQLINHAPPARSQPTPPRQSHSLLQDSREALDRRHLGRCDLSL